MKRQRGVALITAMLITTIATILAGSMLWSANLDRRRAENLLFSDQALQYALGAEAWAKNVLRQDLEDSQIDYPGEEWAVALPPLPVEGGYIEGLVEDMQARFNINNLVDGAGVTNPTAVAQFQRMLQALEIDPQLAGIVADWLDADIDAGFPDGAEDDSYTALEPPYRTANTTVTSASELLAVVGFEKELYQRISPFVVALPPGTAINVNTALGPVLQSMSENMSAIEAESIMEQTNDAPFEDLSEFQDRVQPEALQGLSVSSSFFRVTARVALGTTRFTMYSLVERDSQGNVLTRLRHFATE